MEECAVCCEKMNKSTRKPIKCGWCDFCVCASCTQRFLLDKDTTDRVLSYVPTCMNCKHQWNREFLNSQFTKTFVNGPLKAHREELLFEREKSMLPDTQPYAEMMKEIFQLTDEVAKVSAELKKEKSKINPHIRFGREYYEWLKDHNIKVATLKETVNYYHNILAVLRTRMNGSSRQEPIERRQFIKPCPTDGCRGFLSTQWKCGLCSVKVCSKCHEIKPTEAEGEDGDGHVCNPENVATVEALMKVSKPCPKCGAMIQRIEGCSQMFHTPLSGGCGAVFDWNTLRLYGENEVVHNPHWYEYQRHINNGNVPRQMGDGGIPCGAIPTINQMTTIITRLFHRPDSRVEYDKWIRNIYVIHQGYYHNQYTMLPHYAVAMTGDNRSLRVEYLLKRIDDAKFKTAVQQREKAREKRMHIHQILTMYQGAVGDIVTRMSHATSAQQFEAIYNEIAVLVEYTNECFEKAAKVYECVRPYIDQTFKMTTTKPKK